MLSGTRMLRNLSLNATGRDGFGTVPEGEPTPSDAEFNRTVDELVAKVEEYKLDDPQ